MFELSQVRCFIAIAEEKHFGRAAERLHMSQPPLSRQLQSLERQLGATLIARGNRVAALTPAGVGFLKDARALMKLAEEARTSVMSVANGVAGQLSVGFTSASSYDFVPKMVAYCRDVLPNLQLRLRELVSGTQEEALASRTLDVGFLRLPVDRTIFSCVCVDRDRMVLALPKGHPLARLDTVPLARLTDEEMVMYMPDESRYHHHLVTSALSDGDVQPRFVQFARETHTILGLVGCGVGLAIVPSMGARFCPEGVEIRPLTGFRRMSELHMVWRNDSENPALASFRDMVRIRFNPS